MTPEISVSGYTLQRKDSDTVFASGVESLKMPFPNHLFFPHAYVRGWIFYLKTTVDYINTFTIYQKWYSSLLEELGVN